MPVAPESGFIAVDWGTTRLRASLVDAGGAVRARTHSDLGVQSVPKGGFPAVLAQVCGEWFAADPSRPVLMAGMVGSRNGWVEAPYLRCPCGPADAAEALTAIEGLGRPVLLVPGVDTLAPAGVYDVMRGEETQVFGTGVDDGLVCLPGTHCKWVELRDGRMVRFATYITGELYAAMTQSFVGRLAEGSDATEIGWAAAARIGADERGLSHTLFQARTQVLCGNMPAGAVRPFLARLLVEAELDDACGQFERASKVVLVAAEPQLGLYERAFAARGIETAAVDPAVATLKGLDRIMTMRRAS